MSFRSSYVMTCAAALSFVGGALGAQPPPPVAEQITAAVQALPRVLRQLRAQRLEEGNERTHLVTNDRLNFVWGELHFTAAEAD
jgi:hypothetical protein